MKLSFLHFSCIAYFKTNKVDRLLHILSFFNMMLLIFSTFLMEFLFYSCFISSIECLNPFIVLFFKKNNLFKTTSSYIYIVSMLLTKI